MVEYYEGEVGAGGGGLDEESSDAEADDWGNGTLKTPESSLQNLRHLIRTWYRNGQPDSKFQVLKQCLAELQESQPGEPIVIFSYFKKTLDHLSRRLGALGYSTTVISGAFAPEERDKRIAQFREGRHQILLSTEVGSEGLDFQFCHILFNYDLPWNPMVVEQRIGRLDRFGQKAEKILIFNLSAPGTIEDEILTRLYRRINLFESYIGDLEAILGNEILTLTKDLFDPELSEAQRSAKIEQAGVLLEKRKLQYEEWERASPQFIGHDEYYRQEIDRVQLLGRYIRAEDLAILVADFLVHFDRRSDLIEEGPGVYRLEISDKFREFVMRQPEDPQKAEFCTRLHRDPLRITFNSDIAERDKDLIFLHVRHFLIRGIVNEYSKDPHQFHPVAKIAISPCEAVPTGTYVYLVGRATIRAAREQDVLLPVVVKVDSIEILDEDASEIGLARMVSEGTDWKGAVPAMDRLQCAFDEAESHLAYKFQSRRDEVERINQAFVTARLASVMESYRLKIQRKSDLLTRAQANQQQLSYVRMLEGGIRNLRTEQRAREVEIEEKRTVTAEHTVFAAGVLIVGSS